MLASDWNASQIGMPEQTVVLVWGNPMQQSIYVMMKMKPPVGLLVGARTVQSCPGAPCE